MDGGDLLTSPRTHGDGARDALAGAAASVLVVDRDGQVTYANPAAGQMFAPLEPAKFTLRGLLALSGLSGAGDLASAVESRAAQGDFAASVRAGLPDGRVLDAQLRKLDHGSTVITLNDVTAYVREAELAMRDALTGLPNRRVFHERLSELLMRAEERNVPVAVLCLDLDRFKTVNDSLGHPVGDALLMKVAERLRNCIRAGDMVARLGGDEFAIVQADVHQPQAAQALATRLVDLIGRTYLVSGYALNVGASIGIALAPADGRDCATIMRHADLALYSAKSDGRSRFRFFQPVMNEEMQARRALEEDLRRAVAFKELELAYQPQFNLDADALVGFEALLRWRSPTRGLVSPGLFVPLAEEIGLIGTIGAWVLRAACQNAAAWDRPLSIAVNISAIQFTDEKLVGTVKSVLEETGLPAERLELEITEGALLQETDTVLRQLHALKALGVRISMDDFGTGYSSLSYLQKFPFDKIKIDQSFIRGADGSQDCNAIVRAVAALGASLGMKTTAEGVETAEQLQRIRAQGCSEVQGYLTGRPVTAAAAASLVRDSCSSDTQRSFAS